MWIAAVCCILCIFVTVIMSVLYARAKSQHKVITNTYRVHKSVRNTHHALAKAPFWHWQTIQGEPYYDHAKGKYEDHLSLFGPGALFGYSVAIHPQAVAIAAPGESRVVLRGNQDYILKSPLGDYFFGAQVAFWQDLLLVLAPYETTQEEDRDETEFFGNIHMFTLEGKYNGLLRRPPHGKTFGEKIEIQGTELMVWTNESKLTYRMPKTSKFWRTNMTHPYVSLESA